MAEAAADVIDKATTAVQVAARPNVLITIFALAAMVGCGFLVWRDEVRADAQIAVLQGMSQHLGDLDSDLKAVGVPVGSTRAKRLAAQAAAAVSP